MGAQCPLTFSPGNFCWLTGKKEARKRKIEKKRRKIVWEGGRKCKLEEEKVRKGAENSVLFCFVLFCCLFCFVLFCVVLCCVVLCCVVLCCLSLFWNLWNLFGVYQNGIFTGKKEHFPLGKNQEKWLCPSWKIFHLSLCLFIKWSEKFGKAWSLLKLQTTHSLTKVPLLSSTKDMAKVHSVIWCLLHIGTLHWTWCWRGTDFTCECLVKIGMSR